MVGVAGRALVGALGGLNQASIRGILAYSSFVHNRWLLVASVEAVHVFVVYFLTYIVQLGVLVGSCFIMHRSTFYRGRGSLLRGLIIIRLSGMPPFGGFVPKLLLLIAVDYKGILIIPLLGRVIAIKYYTRSCCALMLECSIVWDNKLIKWC